MALHSALPCESAHEVEKLDLRPGYVDYLDPALGARPTREMANRLRDRIASNRKFIIVATENAKSSRWVPWEVGCAEGRKEDSEIASLPVVAFNGQGYDGTEYLHLYSQIAREGNTWYVFDAESKRHTSLAEWLRSELVRGATAPVGSPKG